MPAPRILIVGGSTRAAADSVRRAGWQPVCADLFADLDLRHTAEVIPVHRYPFSLPDDVAHVRADGWFYCGALENHPEILRRILAANASYGPLLGTSPDALRFVRNPQWLAEALRSAGVMSLEVASQSSPPTPDGSWLQKPLASAGGRSIRVWDETAAQIPFPEPHYFQHRALGIGLSAIFRFESDEIEWLGASRELQTNSTFHAPSDFAYCGSCGPLNRMSMATGNSLDSRQRIHRPTEIPQEEDTSSVRVHSSAVDQKVIQHQLTAMARVLVEKAPGLRGLVGLDFRLDGDTVWLTEVNPRYTASVEVLELTSGRSFLNPHSIQTATTRHLATRSNPLLIAKQILYGSAALKAPDLSRYLTVGDPWQIPIIADIPVPGTIIERGWPICTVFAEGTNNQTMESALSNRLTIIESALTEKSA